MKSDIKMIAMGCKPDPYKFEIDELEHVGNCTIILANYEGCKTFDGNKLMLLRGIHNLMDFETLDPHFLDEEYAVVARFIPNEVGWKMARVAAYVFN
jgi:hypothetical protein